MVVYSRWSVTQWVLLRFDPILDMCSNQLYVSDYSGTNRCKYSLGNYCKAWPQNCLPIKYVYQPYKRPPVRFMKNSIWFLQRSLVWSKVKITIAHLFMVTMFYFTDLGSSKPVFKPKSVFILERISLPGSRITWLLDTYLTRFNPQSFPHTSFLKVTNQRIMFY